MAELWQGLDTAKPIVVFMSSHAAGVDQDKYRLDPGWHLEYQSTTVLVVGIVSEAAKHYAFAIPLPMVRCLVQDPTVQE